MITAAISPSFLSKSARTVSISLYDAVSVSFSAAAGDTGAGTDTCGHQAGTGGYEHRVTVPVITALKLDELIAARTPRAPIERHS